MAGKAELGKQFLDELKGKLPDTLRGNIDSILSSPEAQAALETVGSRVSPLDEERAELERLRTQTETTQSRLTNWRGRLDTWKADMETKFTEREQQLSAREAAPASRTPDDPPPAARAGEVTMTKDEIAKIVAEVIAPREGAYVQYVADAYRFGDFHRQNFKETLNINELVQHPKIGELGVQGVYELVHKEKLEKMRTDAVAAREAEIRADERSKIAAGAAVDMPYPMGGEGSPLDALTMDPATRPKGDPAAAARMYDQLVSGRP